MTKIDKQNKANKNHYSRRKTNQARFGSFIIDMIAFLILVVAFAIELVYREKLIICAVPVVDIILILLPTIITIVSIVLSLTKEKIYGITFSNFNRLRGFWFYSFLHMLICVGLIFVFYTFFSVFNLIISLFVLDGISVFYFLYFSIQEIPILMHDGKRIGNIIKKRYKNRDIEDLLGKQSNEDLLKNVITNIILEEGLFTAYKTLKEKDKEYNATLLNYLLELQNRFFWSAIGDIEFIKSNLTGEYRGVDIFKALDVGFRNIEELLEFKQDYDYKEIVYDEDETYQLTRSLFSLYKICVFCELPNKWEERLKQVSNRLFFYRFSKNKDKSKPYSFIILMAVSTLPSGETWFLKALRDSDYSIYSLFSLDEHPIGLFLSILISFLIEKFPESKGKLEAFIDEPVGGLNGDGRSWRQHIIRNIESCSGSCTAKLLPSLLEIYNSVKESYFESFFIKQSGVIHDYYGFDKSYLFNAWLEMITSSHNYYFDVDDIEKVIENLSPEEKSRLAYYLPTKWIKDGQLKDDIQLEFLSIFGEDEIKPTAMNASDKLIDVLVKTHRDYFKTGLDKKAAESDADLSKIKVALFEPFEKVKGDIFYNNKLDLGDELPKMFTLRIDGFDFDGLTEAYSKNILFSIENSIISYVSSMVDATAKLESEQFVLTDESKDRIRKLNPDFANKDNVLNYDLDSNDLIKNIRLVDSDFLPGDFFGKDGSFSFKIELDQLLSEVRMINAEEIEYIVENEYQMINGLYKFSDFKNDETRSFLVTKDELVRYLKKKIVVAKIVFRQKVELSKNNYLIWLDKK